VLFTLDGEQGTAERLGEANAARVRGGRVAGDRNNQGFGRPSIPMRWRLRGGGLATGTERQHHDPGQE
jgi:hypothetical protein